MERLTRSGAVEGAASLLGRWISGPEAHTDIDTFLEGSSAREAGIDALVRVGDHQFLLEAKLRPTAEALENAAVRFSRLARGSAVPLLVVPYMSEQGRTRCERAGIAWLDLSGNADIRGPGLRLLIDGKPNRFKRPGRVSSAFAAKGARVTRLLLQDHNRSHPQAEIADRTGLSPGHVSKVVTRLLAEKLIDRDDDGAVLVSHPSRLLDAWASEYDFGKHERKRYVVVARSGQETTVKVATHLERRGLRHAVTGLSGAYWLDHFANFRIATLYVEAVPETALLAEMGLREVDQGENLWLVLPNDEGVFQGTAVVDGLVCAQWVQVYLDLAGHPERSKEAAEHLRQTHQSWGGRS